VLLLPSSALCAFFWLMGAATLEAVLTERLRPDDYNSRDPLAELTLCLGGKRGAVMQDLALHDLAQCAWDRAAARRAEVFADETGARWAPLGAHCLAGIAAVGAALAEALPKRPAAALAVSGAGAGGAAPAASAAFTRWNAPAPAAGKVRAAPVVCALRQACACSEGGA
jgi:hypothetical protein